MSYVIMVCPVCRPTDSYFGRLVFDTDPDPEPCCPNHGDERVPLTPPDG